MYQNKSTWYRRSLSTLFAGTKCTEVTPVHQNWAKPFAIVSASWRKHIKQRRRGCYRRIFGCLFLLILLVFACSSLFWFVQRTHAAPLSQEEETQPLAIYLLIDNSQSMFDLAGVGSDPELLRLDAARLFISYLGVDSTRAIHQCGVIFFGTEADPIVPIMPLVEDKQRVAMLTAIQNPPMMGWTDHMKALALAQQELEPMTGYQPAIVLLTDGKPQWNESPTAQETESYIFQLRELGAQLVEAKIPLFMILLANEATDKDDEIATVWKPLWEEMASATRPGRFYHARQPQDLVDIYHDIVVALLGSHTAGPIVQAEVGAGGLRQTVVVEPQLERLTLVVSKGSPELSVTILQPNGLPLTDDMQGVRQAGGNGQTPEEIWVIDYPTSGDWTVLVSGEGRITVWKDYRIMPTPTPAPSATTSPSETPQPSVMPTSTMTATAVPPTRVVPTSQPTSIPAPVTPPDRSRPGLWLMGLMAVSGCLFGGYRLWRRQQPYVLGMLEHLSGPGFLSGQDTVDLDEWRRSLLQVGFGGEIPLVETSHSCVLCVGMPFGDTYEVIIKGNALVNDKPVSTELSLQDGDIIMLGQTRLQYTNLRLRMAQEEALNNWHNPDLAF